MRFKIMTTITEVIDADHGETVDGLLRQLQHAKQHRLPTHYQVSLEDEDGVRFQSAGGFGK